MATRASKPQDATFTVGIDVGFGVTKVVTPAAKILFPSVAGHARKVKWETKKLSDEYPGDQITDGQGTQWFIGELALKHLTPGELLSLRARAANEIGEDFRLRLMAAALGKLLPGKRGDEAVHIRLATGLPVDHMPDAPSLKDALMGQHIIKTDQTEFVANIVEVMVMPQPYGTIYSNLLLTNGTLNPCHTPRRTGVIDVGTYTTDLALDDEGEYVDAESGSIERGVSTIHSEIAAFLERTYKQKFAPNIIEGIVRTGCGRIAGKEVDFKADVSAATQQLRESVIHLTTSLWKEGQHIDVIYLTGGGAELVAGEMKSLYPQARLVTDAQLANAQGYLNYALFKAQGI